MCSVSWKFLILVILYWFSSKIIKKQEILKQSIQTSFWSLCFQGSFDDPLKLVIMTLYELGVVDKGVLIVNHMSSSLYTDNTQLWFNSLQQAAARVANIYCDIATVNTLWKNRSWVHSRGCLQNFPSPSVLAM